VFSPPQDRYKLTVNLDGSGTVTIDPGESSYASGTEVTLNATADAGWTFSSWTGDISTTENPTNVTMNGDKNVTAVFTAEANAPPEVSNPEPADLATGVPVSTSLLNFTLSDANADSMDYYISTSPDIGSDSALGVPDGTYNLPISGLTYDTTCTWWVNVTDGTDWTNTTYTFTTEPLLLLDSEFNDSVDSDDLRANNATAQDWYESRAQVPTLLFLDESDVDGNAGKKAGFAASASGNAYLTQEFSSAQAGTFSVQWDIYVDSILAVSPYRAGQMMIGSTSASYGPNRNDAVRFVFLAFNKTGGATSGTADLVAMLDFNTQVLVASDLNLDQWYTIKVDVDVAAGTYDAYVDGVYEGTFDACTALSSLTHISFAQWNDGAGAFYVDNVFSPVVNRYRLTVNVDGNGSVTVDPGESTYADGTEVELTATADSGWRFSEWSGDLTSTGNPVNVTMNSDKNITAIFTLNVPPTIDSSYPVADPSILEGESQVFNVTYHDDDGDILIVQWLLNSSNVGTGDEYTFTSDYDDSGVYNVTVTVSDGDNSTSHTWLLTVLDVGPTLSMPFNSDEGSVAVDESGYGNNGTVYNATWVSDYGGCYLFKASEEDYIEVPDDRSLDGAGTWTEITIEFWIKPTIDNKGVRLIEKRSAGSSYQIGFQTTPSTGIDGNQLYWNVWTSTSYKEIVAPFGLLTDKWSHVVCTYKDGVGMVIYVNGTSSVSASHTGTINDSTCPINIGRRGDDSSYFTGLMDYIRIYTKALPQPLIQQNYNETKTVYISQLLVDSEFDYSADSNDLRNNGPEQDWYESRNQVPTLLVLNDTDVSGNTGKKAEFLASRNAAGSEYVEREGKLHAH